MYGLIIEGFRFMVLENFGPQVLSQILEATQMGEKSISTHDIYPENMFPNMLKATCEITGMTADQVGVLAGRYFVQFLVRHGYGDLMHVMGRRFSDFLKGLDNIHEYFRFSYPKIRPPSFYCSSESEDGLILHYRSRRKGYVSYVIGQLVELARLFYKQELGVKVLQKTDKGKFLFVVIHLSFSNSGLSLDNRLKEKVKSLNEYLPVDTMSFLRMFPFHIAFNRRLDIIMCGQGLINMMPQIIGLNMTEIFDLQKPCIKFTAEGCLAHANCNFQLESLKPVVKKNTEEVTVKINGVGEEKEEGDKQEEHPEQQPHLTLKGPIVYLKSCDTFLLLATCVVDGLDDMFRMGLFLNDYGDADCNREIIMASIQKSDHLKNLLQSEKQRSQVLTEMTKEIAENKRKARQLLTQMMPVEVANTMLRTGRSEQCESFECVTIAFAKVINFQKQTDHMAAVEIVNLLNNVYLVFDEIVDIHGVYKVETIGESYMISAGVPYKNSYDTCIVADCCLHMISRIRESDLKFSDGKKLQVKIGMFTGPCVGGIVGHKNPRYCLFGDTVNCASRMETHNQVPLTIQSGERTKIRLDKQAPNKFKVKPRGVITVKGKGDMKAYEIVSKSGRPRYIKHPPKKPEMENDDNEEFDDVVAEEIERTSAMSRMSLGEAGEATRSNSEEDAETAAYNESIAQILAQVAATAQFSTVSELPARELEHRNSDKNILEQLKRQSSEPKFRRQGAHPPLVSKKGNSVTRLIEENAHQIGSLEKEPSVISLASSTIQERDERLENISINSVTSNNNPIIADDTFSLKQEEVVLEGGNQENTEEEVKVEMTTTDFSSEPIDKVPVDLPTNNPPEHPYSDSTDPEELWKTDKPFEIATRKKKTQTKEMKSSKKLLESQKKKDPELQQKKALPDLKKKDKKEKPEKKPEPARNQDRGRGGHSHNGGDPSCRCEDIREDPKLKTKVCSIQ